MYCAPKSISPASRPTREAHLSHELALPPTGLASGSAVGKDGAGKDAARTSSCSLTGHRSLCDPGTSSGLSSWIGFGQIANKSVQKLLADARSSNQIPDHSLETKQSVHPRSKSGRIEQLRKEALATKGDPLDNLAVLYTREPFDTASLGQELAAVLALPVKQHAFDKQFDLLESMQKLGARHLNGNLIANQFKAVLRMPENQFPVNAKLVLLAALLAEGHTHMDSELMVRLRDIILSVPHDHYDRAGKVSLLTSVFAAGRSNLAAIIGDLSDSIFTLKNFQSTGAEMAALSSQSRATIGESKAFLKATLLGNLYVLCCDQVSLDDLRRESKKILDLPAEPWTRQNQIHMMISLYAADTTRFAVAHLADRAMIILALAPDKFSDLEKDRLVNFLFRREHAIEACVEILELPQRVLNPTLSRLLIESLFRNHCKNMTQDTEVAEAARHILRLTVEQPIPNAMYLLNAMGRSATHLMASFTLSYKGATLGPFPEAVASPHGTGMKNKDAKGLPG